LETLKVETSMSIVRRALDAFALRFSEAEKRLSGLTLVTHPANDDGSVFNTLWLAEFGIEPRLIMDIGSFDAFDAIRFKRGFPQARVIAFEADPDRFTTVKNAAGSGVVAVQSAVGVTDGEATWYQAKSADSVSSQGSLFPHAKTFAGFSQTKLAKKVPVTRLDTYCRENGIDEIDFAHIDVEGAEFEVLSGLGPLRPKMIFLEMIARETWIGSKSSAELHRLLTRLGYILAGDFRSDRLYVRADLVRVDL
jgi:FkbM family methyltransferase